MKWLLIALIVLFLLIFIVTITKLTILLQYYHNKDNDHLKLEFKAWFGLIRYKLEVPLIKIDENSPTVVIKEKKQAGSEKNMEKKDTKQYSTEDFIDSLKDFRELITHIVSLKKIVQKFLRKLSIKKLNWHTVVGVGDAAYTGMLTGGLWAIKGSIIGLLSHYLKLSNPPDITITPQFQNAVTQSAITCIIQFRIGHAIVAGIKLIKYWKGGKARFQTKPLSALSNDKTKTM